VTEIIILYEGPIVTRDEARARGLKRFFPGEPYVCGHIGERYVCNGTCCECVNRKAMAYAKTERGSASRRAYKQSEAGKAAQHRGNHTKAAKAGRKQYRKTEKGRAAEKRYQDTDRHRLYIRAANALRRAREEQAGGSFTPADIEKLLALQHYRCANPACNHGKNGKPADLRKVGYEIDHRIPVVLGGSNDISNLQLLCMPCNRRKCAKDPLIWAQENGFLL
jgi:5-methylcytosine-specific restriction endonuclease McrA